MDLAALGETFKLVRFVVGRRVRELFGRVLRPATAEDVWLSDRYRREVCPVRESGDLPTAIGARIVPHGAGFRPLSARGPEPPRASCADSVRSTKVRFVLRVPVLAEFKRRTSEEEKSSRVVCLVHACVSSRFAIDAAVHSGANEFAY